MARRLDATGARPSAPLQVKVGSVDACPAVAVDAAGNCVVSWSTGGAISVRRIDTSDVDYGSSQCTTLRTNCSLSGVRCMPNVFCAVSPPDSPET